MFLLLDLVAERVVQGLQVHQSLSLHVSFQVLQIFIPQSPSLVSFSIHLKFCILKAALQLLLRSLQALDTSGQHAAHAARAQQSFAPVPSPGQGPARVTECNRCGHYSQLGMWPADTCCIFCGSGRLHLTHQALHISTIFNYWDPPAALARPCLHQLPSVNAAIGFLDLAGLCHYHQGLGGGGIPNQWFHHDHHVHSISACSGTTGYFDTLPHITVQTWQLGPHKPQQLMIQPYPLGVVHPQGEPWDLSPAKLKVFLRDFVQLRNCPTARNWFDKGHTSEIMYLSMHVQI